MDVYCIVNQQVRLSMPPAKVQLNEPLAYSNVLAHAMQVTVLKEDGTAEDLSGVSVSGNFLKSDGNTVTPITGTVSGNVAQVLLPGACYATPGRFKFTMDMTKSGSTRTALWVEGHVENEGEGNKGDQPVVPVHTLSTSECQNPGTWVQYHSTFFRKSKTCFFSFADGPDGCGCFSGTGACGTGNKGGQ